MFHYPWHDLVVELLSNGKCRWKMLSGIPLHNGFIPKQEIHESATAAYIAANAQREELWRELVGLIDLAADQTRDHFLREEARASIAALRSRLLGEGA